MHLSLTASLINLLRGQYLPFEVILKALLISLQLTAPILREIDNEMPKISLQVLLA